MAAFEIRPRRATELVDASFQLLRRFYPQLVAVSAIAMAPSVLARIALRQQLTDPTAMAAHPLTAGGMVLLSSLCIVLADAVLIVAVSDGYLDGDVQLPRALAQGWSRAGSMLAAVFLRYLMIFGVVVVLAIVTAVLIPKSKANVAAIGVLLLSLPFILWFTIYVALRTFAVANAVLLERVGPLAALSRSWELSKGSAAHVFFSLGLAWTLYIIILMVVGAVGAVTIGPAVTQIISSVLIIPIYPLLAVVSTLLYYDLRIRKEGFDLEVMSRELGTAAPSPIPAV